MQKSTEHNSNTENESTGLTPRMMRIRTRLESGNTTPIGSSLPFNSSQKKRNREETIDSDDEDFVVPSDFDIGNFDKVKNFIESLNNSQLRVIFLKNGIINKGDLEDKKDIYEYFLDFCKSRGFSKLKKKKKFNLDIEKLDIPQPSFDFDVSEITIPPGFDIKNFRSVSKLIDSLNVPQLQKVLDRKYLVELGDIQEERIKEYFKAACDASGVKKTKRKKKSKKVPKVVTEWNLKDDE